MTAFRFRLAKILDWYDKQCRIEENRLYVCRDRVVQARIALDRHQNEVAARQMELVQSSVVDAHELIFMSAYCERAKQQEIRLGGICRDCEHSLEQQKRVTQAAQRRLRLMEKLRERRFSEHTYEAERELEQLASDSHLAGFARSLVDGPD